jgi:hypothetical protein
MSSEALLLLQWLLIIFLGAYTYEIGGRFLNTASKLELGLCCIAVYVFLAALLKWIFAALKHHMGDKLLAANAFGKGEYVLGMFAGLVRYFCILVFCLSVLHGISLPPPAAPAKTPKAAKGESAVLSNLSPSSLKEDVFGRSLSGPVLKRHLSDLLLKSTPAKAPPKKKDGLGERRQRVLDDASGNK